eukprot:gene6390-7407_t
MGKFERPTKQTGNRHDPLGKQIADGEKAHTVARKRVGKGLEKKKNAAVDETQYIDEQEKVIPEALSRKILSQIRQQATEAEEEDRSLKAIGQAGFDDDARPAPRLLSFDDADADIDGEENDDGFEQFSDGEDEDAFGDDEDVEEIDEDDERILQMFMGGGAGDGGVGSKHGVRFTLGELIESKLREQAEKTVDPSTKINPKVLDVYTKVGQLLAHYTSGKVPRAFRILPNFANWEDLLYLTRPDKWTPHATRVATKLFCMGSNSKLTQRFLSIVLLPKMRDDIADHKKLNYHYYMALKKCLYRPSAFYKAILLPLAEGGDSTLLEAKIFSSVVAKVSIPVLHSSVALMKLAMIDRYNGATSIFIRTLCDKKYSLPFRVIDELVKHFVRFTDERRALPVLWHHSLLSFVQRYKNDIKPEQRDALKILLRHQTHHIITVEIRRELFAQSSSSSSDTKMSDL